MATTNMDAFLAAADALYKGNDAVARRKANDWLQDFQRTPEAWETANAVLLAQDLPVEPRMLAAITFHNKSVFDLEQLPPAARTQLRDTLLVALQGYATGPRVIQSRICLSLAAMALQMLDWQNVVPTIIERFGNDVSTVGVLLEFLTVLPEEVIMNHRIPIEEDAYRPRVKHLLTDSVEDVLQRLTVYISAQGITPQIQMSVFRVLRSWLRSGEVSATKLSKTTLFPLAFDALASDQLFDDAVDVICDLIIETQEVEENIEVIQLIIPRLVPLRQELDQAGDEEDKVRGLCRIFAQAGETYHTLVLRHKAEFFPIVDALATCAAYCDLDIVRITFRFWYLLAGAIGKSREDSSLEPFLVIYQKLIHILIGHLRFPDDGATQTSQERDDFREFRHVMGDTLKDCCHVLGSKACLAEALGLLKAALAAPQLIWQQVEAPLFSMRAMGGQVDPQDDEVVAEVVDIVPKLPDHPKLKYAGLLVLGRYTEWIAKHSDQIAGILSYISAGFEQNDQDVSAAAARALKFMCIDCKAQLVPYLPQLYDFFGVLNDQLGPEDLEEVSEAIAFIISGMPTSDALEALVRFTQPLLQSAVQNATATAPGSGENREALKKVADRLSQVNVMLKTLDNRISQELPDSCSKTAQEVYALLDKILEIHGGVYFISEATCSLVRRGMAFFGDKAIACLPALLPRLASCFEQSGFPGYIWIAGKCIDHYGRNPDVGLRAALQSCFDRISAKVMLMLENTMPEEISDVIDDYVHTCSAAASSAPSIIFLSQAFPHAFRVALHGLGLYQANMVHAALSFVRDVVGNDSLSVPVTPSQPGTPLPPELTDPSAAPSPQALAAFAANIRHTIGEYGFQLCGTLLNGLVTSFPTDAMPIVVSVIRMLSAVFPREVATWMPLVADSLPASYVPVPDRTRFIEVFQAAIASGNLDQIRSSVQGLYNASRKARERARMDRIGPLDR